MCVCVWAGDLFFISSLDSVCVWMAEITVTHAVSLTVSSLSAPLVDVFKMMVVASSILCITVYVKAQTQKGRMCAFIQ